MYWRLILITALDPGPTHTALVCWNGSIVQVAKYEPNAAILDLLKTWAPQGDDPLAIEQVASYGMPVGAEVFETVFWTGRFAEAYGADRVTRIPRLTVKMHLCHDSRAKDANIRRALLDRFGAPGTKRAPSVLYGISGDLWAALALAVTFYDRGQAGVREVA
jgi:hypothetical protein